MLSPIVCPLRVGCASVRGLHDPAAPSRADEKAVRRGFQPLGPLGDEARELAGFGVVPPEWSFCAESRRTEEHDGVVDALPLEDLKWLDVLGKNA